MDKKKKKNKKRGKSDNEDFDENIDSAPRMRSQSNSSQKNSVDISNNAVSTYKDDKGGRKESHETQVNFNICVPKGYNGLNVHECDCRSGKTEQAQQCDVGGTTNPCPSSNDEPLVIITVYPNRRTTITQNNTIRTITNGHLKKADNNNNNNNNRGSVNSNKNKQRSRNASPESNVKRRAVERSRNTGTSPISKSSRQSEGSRNRSRSTSPKQKKDQSKNSLTRTTRTNRPTTREEGRNVRSAKAKDISPNRNHSYNSNDMPKTKNKVPSTKSKDFSPNRNSSYNSNDMAKTKTKVQSTKSKDTAKISNDSYKTDRSAQSITRAKQTKNKVQSTKSKDFSPNRNSSIESDDTFKRTRVKETKNVPSTKLKYSTDNSNDAYRSDQSAKSLSGKDTKYVQTAKPKHASNNSNDTYKNESPKAIKAKNVQTVKTFKSEDALKKQHLQDTSTNELDLDEKTKKFTSKININLEATINQNYKMNKGTNTRIDNTEEHPKSALKTILTKVLNKKQMSNVSINIDTDNELYNVLFQQKPKEIVNCDCIKNCLSDESMKNLLLTSDYDAIKNCNSYVKVQDSLEISFRQKDKKDHQSIHTLDEHSDIINSDES